MDLTLNLLVKNFKGQEQILSLKAPENDLSSRLDYIKAILLFSSHENTLDIETRLVLPYQLNWNFIKTFITEGKSIEHANTISWHELVFVIALAEFLQLSDEYLALLLTRMQNIMSSGFSELSDSELDPNQIESLVSLLFCALDSGIDIKPFFTNLRVSDSLVRFRQGLDHIVYRLGIEDGLIYYEKYTFIVKCWSLAFKDNPLYSHLRLIDPFLFPLDGSKPCLDPLQMEIYTHLEEGPRMVSPQEFRQALKEKSRLFQEILFPPQPVQDQGWCLAGGSVVNTLIPLCEEEYKRNKSFYFGQHQMRDLDFFIYGPCEEKRKQNLVALIQRINCAIRRGGGVAIFVDENSVITIYIQGEVQVYAQVIHTTCKNQMQVIEDFDIDYCKACYTPWYGVQVSPDCYEAIRTMTVSSSLNITTTDRYCKALAKGFSVAKGIPTNCLIFKYPLPTPLNANSVDIDKELQNVERILGEHNSNYYSVEPTEYQTEAVDEVAATRYSKDVLDFYLRVPRIAKSLHRFYIPVQGSGPLNNEMVESIKEIHNLCQLITNSSDQLLDHISFETITRSHTVKKSHEYILFNRVQDKEKAVSNVTVSNWYSHNHDHRMKWMDIGLGSKRIIIRLENFNGRIYKPYSGNLKLNFFIDELEGENKKIIDILENLLIPHIKAYLSEPNDRIYDSIRSTPERKYFCITVNQNTKICESMSGEKYSVESSGLIGCIEGLDITKPFFVRKMDFELASIMKTNRVFFRLVAKKVILIPADQLDCFNNNKSFVSSQIIPKSLFF